MKKLKIKWRMLKSTWRDRLGVPGFPLMWRLKHNRDVAYLQFTLQQETKKTQIIRAEMDRVLPKLVSVSIVPDHLKNLYRLVLDMDEHLITGAFMHGNDKSMIECFSERVGIMVYRELSTMNMHRFAPANLRAPAPYRY